MIFKNHTASNTTELVIGWIIYSLQNFNNNYTLNDLIYIAGLAWLPQGRLLTLDHRAKELIVFSQGGQKVHTARFSPLHQYHKYRVVKCRYLDVILSADKPVVVVSDLGVSILFRRRNQLFLKQITFFSSCKSLKITENVQLCVMLNWSNNFQDVTKCT